MARDWRHDQKLRIAIWMRNLPLEVQQPAKGLLPHDLLSDRHRLAIDDRRFDVEFRLPRAARTMFEQFASGHDGPAKRRERNWIERIFEEELHGVRSRTRGRKRRMALLMDEILEHVSLPERALWPRLFFQGDGIFHAILEISLITIGYDLILRNPAVSQHGLTQIATGRLANV